MSASNPQHGLAGTTAVALTAGAGVAALAVTLALMRRGPQGPPKEDENPWFDAARHQLDPRIGERLERAKQWYDSHAVEGFYKAKDGLDIHYAEFVQPDANAPALVLLTGWSEAVARYAEYLYDVYHDTGYSIFAIDHRSQGESARYHSDDDTRKSVVFDFAHHVEDVEEYVTSRVVPRAGSFVLQGFSLGGLVATRFALDAPPSLQRHLRGLLLVCPCLVPQTDGLPPTLVEALASLACLVGVGERYIPGHPGLPDHRLRQPPFSRTTSEVTRNMFWEGIRKSKPLTIVNGLSFVHLREFLRARVDRPDQGARISVPLLVITAGRDTFVVNEAHRTLVSSCAGPVRHVVVDDALHEILHERDEIRDGVMRAVEEFLRERQA